ncbi:LysR family transcriptional regulator [Sphingomonas koreensis]|nr:LysR family transcriptional regulator [Sphingomonas koreensis]RSU66679.1 LysR family transcriptional regulator [Sphingomonas koreensis]
MDEPNSSMFKPRRLPPLAALRAFEAAARHLSFRAAASELAVTPTAISHQIRLLEATLGLPLFVRRTRQVALTEAGQRLFPALRDGFDGFARVIGELKLKRQSVTVSATTQFTSRRLLPAVPAFNRQHPEIDLRLNASETPVDIAAGAADIAVRYGGEIGAGLRSEPLLAERFGVLCSPMLGLTAPEDLNSVPLLHTDWLRDVTPDWRRWAKLAGVTELKLDQGARFTNGDHAIQAAIAGQGAIVASLILAEEEIRAGLLVQPFGPVIEGIYYQLVTRTQPPSREVEAVLTWLREEVARPRRSAR